MAWRSPHPDFVETRLREGALCHVCPLNGRRKVGHDGPPSAPVIVLGEAPGKDETAHMLGREKYGRPFVGPTGYMMKVRYLAPAGLVDLEPNPNPAKANYPIVRKLNCHIMNVVMCQPPKNKIESKEGKKAVWCCANSARARLRAALEANPNLGIIAAGGTALALVKGAQHRTTRKGGKRKKDSIEKLRGRPVLLDPAALAPIPEALIYKKVLAGVKPPDWWKPNEKVLRQILGWNRRSLKKVLAPPKVVKEKKTRVSKRRSKNEVHAGVEGDMGSGSTTTVSPVRDSVPVAEGPVAGKRREGVADDAE